MASSWVESDAESVVELELKLGLELEFGLDLDMPFLNLKDAFILLAQKQQENGTVILREQSNLEIGPF